MSVEVLDDGRKRIRAPLSDEDRADVASAIRRHHAKQRAGESAPKEVLFQEIARIKKLSKNKLPVFRDFLRKLLRYAS